jgi:uncharacterized YigZ family protein
LAHTETPEAAQQFIKEMNAEFADATHNCWAYVAGEPGSTSRIGMSDAGEPHGTAGRPMLTVLLHSGIGEIAAIVTRYYGGTKLGTGGLVKAYSGAVKHALDTLPTHVRVDTADVDVSFGYGNETLMRQALASLNAAVIDQEYGVGVQFTVRIARSQLDALSRALADVTRGEGQLREH